VIRTTLAIAPLALLTAVTTTTSEAHAADGWITSWEDAKKQAQNEKKDILIDFTGSDWCGWCIRLRDEVFTKEEFRKVAPTQFVLLELDFPRTKKLPEALQKQNDQLRNEFAVRGYPTILLADAQGRAFARTGYEPGGPKAYLEHLDKKVAERKARDELFVQAEKAETDLERAKLLDRALTQLERQSVLIGYGDVMARIIALDKANEAGLRAKYDERIQLAAVEREIGEGDADQAIQLVDAYLKGEHVAGESKQKACFYRARALFLKKDYAGAIVSLEAAEKHEPTSDLARRIPQIIRQVKEQTGG